MIVETLKLLRESMIKKYEKVGCSGRQLRAAYLMAGVTNMGMGDFKIGCPSDDAIAMLGHDFHPYLFRERHVG